MCYNPGTQDKTVAKTLPVCEDGAVVGWGGLRTNGRKQLSNLVPRWISIRTGTLQMVDAGFTRKKNHTQANVCLV